MKKLILSVVTFLSLIACHSEEPINVFNLFADRDRDLPSLVSMKSSDTRTVTLLFSEEVRVRKASCDGETPSVTMTMPDTVKLDFSSPLPVGSVKELYIVVSDKTGNTSSFLLSVSGRNDRIPVLKITEFSTKGTETQPDRIELQAYSTGSTEGVYIADGSKGNENHGFILPQIEMKRGDYLVIWWDRSPDRQSYTNKSGRTVYNIEAGAKKGLATNNGALVIYDTKSGDGEVLDCVIYTDGESTTYSGFGSASVEKTYNALSASFDWLGPAFNSKTTTSTRTVNRFNGSDDTNRADDFYVCTTRGISFGESNTEAVYVPSASQKE